MQNFSSVAYKQRAILNYAQDKRGPIEVINNLLLISDTEKYSNLLKNIKQNYLSIESVLKSKIKLNGMIILIENILLRKTCRK